MINNANDAIKCTKVQILQLPDKVSSKNPANLRHDLSYLNIVMESLKLLQKKEQGYIVKLDYPVDKPLYVIAKCSDIEMICDNDYEHGTGAVDCPFENQCKREGCESNSETPQIFETEIESVWLDFTGGEDVYRLSHMKLGVYKYDLGKTVFIDQQEAEIVLKVI